MQLIAESLTLSRGGRVIIENLSFVVAGGEALQLTGPNGAGKTTLLRALAGHLCPDSGNIRLAEIGASTEVGEHCHAIGHLNGIKPSMTVRENLVFWQRYLGGTAGPSTIDTALDAFALANLDEIPAGYLSAGQKRRLALARLLTATRPVWLLDEPTVSLDRVSAELLSAAIERQLATDGLVVAATHVPLNISSSRELRLGGVKAAAA